MVPMTDTAVSTQDITATVDAWLAAYGEPDDAARAAAVERLWAPDGHLFDPPFAAAGHDEITGATGAVQQQFPGHRFARTTGVDAHHGIARYGWQLVGPDGAVAVAGLDVCVVGEDGRLNRVVGFFGDLPPRED